jgi:hypothetical protein
VPPIRTTFTYDQETAFRSQLVEQAIREKELTIQESRLCVVFFDWRPAAFATANPFCVAIGLAFQIKRNGTPIVPVKQKSDPAHHLVRQRSRRWKAAHRRGSLWLDPD